MKMEKLQLTHSAIKTKHYGIFKIVFSSLFYDKVHSGFMCSLYQDDEIKFCKVYSTWPEAHRAYKKMELLAISLHKQTLRK